VNGGCDRGRSESCGSDSDPASAILHALTSLTQLFGQHGLEIVDVERMKNRGGRIRITAARFGTTSVTTAVHDLMNEESAWVRDLDSDQLFGEAIAPSQDRWAA